MGINLFSGRCWPLRVSLSGVCGTQAVGIMIGMRHYTTQRGKTRNYKLVAHKKKQQCQFSKRVGSDCSSLCKWERAKVHASSLRGCQDKSRTGKRKERSHLTTFNNKVPETDPICLVDEEPLLPFLDLIKLSNVLIFNVGASAESSLTDAPPPQFNKKAISVCRQITGSLHTTYALSFESYVYFPKTRQQLSHRHCH